MNSTTPEPLSITRKRTSKLAISSLILGVLGALDFFLGPTGYRPLIFHFLFAMPSVIAFIFGIIAINKIGKSSNLKGMGFAIAGLILALPVAMFVIGYAIMFALN